MASRFNVTRRGPIWLVQDDRGAVVFQGVCRQAVEWALERADAEPEHPRVPANDWSPAGDGGRT